MSETLEELEKKWQMVDRYVESVLNKMSPQEIRDEASESLHDFFDGLPEFESLYKERFGDTEDGKT